jgi:hypothetical protein
MPSDTAGRRWAFFVPFPTSFAGSPKSSFDRQHSVGGAQVTIVAVRNEGAGIIGFEVVRDVSEKAAGEDQAGLARAIEVAVRERVGR